MRTCRHGCSTPRALSADFRWRCSNYLWICTIDDMTLCYVCTRRTKSLSPCKCKNLFACGYCIQKLINTYGKRKCMVCQGPYPARVIYYRPMSMLLCLLILYGFKCSNPASRTPSYSHFPAVRHPHCSLCTLAPAVAQTQSISSSHPSFAPVINYTACSFVCCSPDCIPVGSKWDCRSILLHTLCSPLVPFAGLSAVGLASS